MKGVKEYALELVDLASDDMVFADNVDMKTELLNGAKNFKHYSYGGCSLIYNEDIAKRLCNATELRKCDNGRKEPNRDEMWLDVQARALYQAFRLIVTLCA